jgi:hypothetical protein
MPVQVGWEDSPQTVMHLIFEGTWTWTEFDTAIEKAFGLVHGVPWTVHFVVDALASDGIPKRDPISHLRRAIKLAPLNSGYVLIINPLADRFFIKVIFQALSRVYVREFENVIYLPSREAAHQFLESRLNAEP